MSDEHLSFRLPSPDYRGDSSGDMRHWLAANAESRALSFSVFPGFFRVPDSVQHAKEILSEPRWPADDELSPERSAMLLASQSVRRFASAASIDLDALRQVAESRRMNCTLAIGEFDVTSEFLRPIVCSAVNQIFGFDLSAKEVEELTLAPDASSEIVTRLKDSSRGLSHSLSVDERSSFGSEAVLLAVMVSYVPLLNLLSFGMRRLLLSGSEDLSIPKLFVKVCAKEGPTYPGLFRSLDEGEWIVPSTWPNTNVNFTFGYGAGRCPGESLVFKIFEVAMSTVASIYPEPVLHRVVFRAGPPFGVDRIVALAPPQ